MICVKSIEVINVDKNYVELIELRPMDSVAVNDNTAIESATSIIELIKGKRFVNSRQEEVYIGMSKQVQQAIGLPFEVYENMKKETQSMLMENIIAANQIQMVRTLGVWQRVKFLFSKKLPRACNE